MAHCADLLVDVLAREVRRGGGRCGGRRVQRGVVLAGDRDPGDRLDAAGDFRLVERVFQVARYRGLVRDVPGQEDQADRDHDQDPEDEHEGVEKGAIVVGAHANTPGWDFGAAQYTLTIRLMGPVQMDGECRRKL